MDINSSENVSRIISTRSSRQSSLSYEKASFSSERSSPVFSIKNSTSNNYQCSPNLSDNQTSSKYQTSDYNSAASSVFPKTPLYSPKPPIYEASLLSQTDRIFTFCHVNKKCDSPSILKNDKVFDFSPGTSFTSHLLLNLPKSPKSPRSSNFEIDPSSSSKLYAEIHSPSGDNLSFNIQAPKEKKWSSSKSSLEYVSTTKHPTGEYKNVEYKICNSIDLSSPSASSFESNFGYDFNSERKWRARHSSIKEKPTKKPPCNIRTNPGYDYQRYSSAKSIDGIDKSAKRISRCRKSTSDLTDLTDDAANTTLNALYSPNLQFMKQVCCLKLTEYLLFVTSSNFEIDPSSSSKLYAEIHSPSGDNLSFNIQAPKEKKWSSSKSSLEYVSTTKHPTGEYKNVEYKICNSIDLSSPSASSFESNFGYDFNSERKWRARHSSIKEKPTKKPPCNIRTNPGYDYQRYSSAKSIDGIDKSAKRISRCRKSTSDLTDLTDDAANTTLTSLSRPTSPRRNGSIKGGLAYLALRRSSRDSFASNVSNEDIGPLNFQNTARGRQRRTSNFLELPVPDHIRPRVCSLPEKAYNPRLSDDLYRLRTFSITNKGGVVNCGDSIINRRSRSNTSVNSMTSKASNISGDRSPFDGSCCGSGYHTVDSSPLGSPEETEVPKYRVVMLGDSGVGKTALVSQFMTSEYMNTYDASLDDEFGERTVSVLLDGEESEMIFIDHPASEMSMHLALVDISNNNDLIRIGRKLETSRAMIDDYVPPPRRKGNFLLEPDLTCLDALNPTTTRGLRDLLGGLSYASKLDASSPNLVVISNTKTRG
ncbi:hypothetical protein FQA39_LY17650 [Lamprigera yunnana]|nr:hypothetical protein FQA39_LY17650 [Lamprigera yunnana]